MLPLQLFPCHSLVEGQGGALCPSLPGLSSQQASAQCTHKCRGEIGQGSTVKTLSFIVHNLHSAAQAHELLWQVRKGPGKESQAKTGERRVGYMHLCARELGLGVLSPLLPSVHGMLWGESKALWMAADSVQLQLSAMSPIHCICMHCPCLPTGKSALALEDRASQGRADARELEGRS